MKRITRRAFLRYSALAGLSLAGSQFPVKIHAAPDSDTILVIIMLAGGPDMRYLIVPPYESSSGTYGNAFWTARARTYGISPDNAEALAAKWEEYHHLESSGTIFGIHARCGWLRDQFVAGNVAIISNVFISRNRDHAHSRLRLEQGDMDAATSDQGRSGWGGRLAKICGKNICSLTSSVRQVCYGPHPTNPADHDNSNVIDAKDTRNMGLYEYDSDYPDGNSWRWNTRGIMSRALTSYYAAKARSLSTDSPYYRIIQHEQSVRSFGRQVNARLDSVPVPEAIEALYTSDSGNQLDSSGFAYQVRNIYDVLACEDILETNILSADYDGWDNHRYMQENIEPHLEDILGTNKGLDVLHAQLNANQPGKAERLVFLLYGEFGRQLAANGDHGTDHGEGNYCLLIGSRINGGIYGEMFPTSEIPRFSQPGEDIEGKTSYERVFARLCDAIKSGSSDSVIPGWQETELEPGVDLSGLIS